MNVGDISRPLLYNSGFRNLTSKIALIFGAFDTDDNDSGLTKDKRNFGWQMWNPKLKGQVLGYFTTSCSSFRSLMGNFSVHFSQFEGKGGD